MISERLKQIKTKPSTKDCGANKVSSTGRYRYIIETEYVCGLKIIYENTRLLMNGIMVYAKMTRNTDMDLRPDSLGTYFKSGILPTKLSPYIKEIKRTKLADMYNEGLEEYLTYMISERQLLTNKPYTDEYIRKLKCAYIREHIKDGFPHKYNTTNTTNMS